MLFIMLIAAAVVLFMILDWLWFKWAFGPHMDKFWWVMAFISVAAGRAFSDVARGNTDLEWTIYISIFMYILAAIIIAIGIGKKVKRSY